MGVTGRGLLHVNLMERLEKTVKNRKLRKRPNHRRVNLTNLDKYGKNNDWRF